MKRQQRINHTPHSNNREQCRAYQASGVAAEVQEADGEAAEDDGEV